jgi:hypothetical protein
MILLRRSILKSPLLKRPEEAGSVPALTPWRREYSAARGDHVNPDGAVYVGAVDMQLAQPQPLTFEVIL